MKRLLFASLALCGLLLFSQCSKQDSAPAVSTTKLRYSDSIFYLSKEQKIYSIYPLGNRPKGSYSVHPDNLELDPASGRVVIRAEDKDNNSLTGLWYKIKFTPADAAAQPDSTYILISGLNYIDRYYRLSQNDSIIYPIYNGDPARTVPQGVYNIGNTDLPINPANGQININELKRRDFFKGTPFRDVTIKYQVSDKSGGAENSMKVIFYYYPTWNDVPQKVSEIMQSHQQLTFGFRTSAIEAAPKTAPSELPGYFDGFNLKDYATWKPRPPCVVIVGN